MRRLDLYDSPVKFDEPSHTYTTPEGQILSGVTGILKSVIFAHKYDSIPQYILDQAAKRGSDIHANCQVTDIFEPSEEEMKDLDPEVLGYLKLKKQHCISMIANEYLVSDECEIATMIDCVDSELNLYDIKTTRELDLEYVSWQLSMCAELFERQNPSYKAGRLYAIWLRPDREALIEVERKSSDDISRLISAYRNGEVWSDKPKPTETGLELEVLRIEQELVPLRNFIKKLESLRDEYMQSIEDEMTAKGVNKIETANMTITRVKGSTSLSFDSKRFEQDHPELFAEYKTKETTRKGYVKITLCNNTQDQSREPAQITA